VRPTTPDPNAEYDDSTKNPLPEGFDRESLLDVNVTGDFVQGRANCCKYKFLIFAISQNIAIQYLLHIP